MTGQAGRAKGKYRWLDRWSPHARIAGEILLDEQPRFLGRKGFFDPFDMFGVQELKGRAVVLEIPGVGRSQVKLRSRPDISGRKIKYPVTIRFEATSGPIPGMTAKELAEALRTPILDALKSAGHEDLADIVLACAVALDGFPEPWEPSEDDADIRELFLLRQGVGD